MAALNPAQIQIVQLVVVCLLVGVVLGRIRRAIALRAVRTGSISTWYGAWVVLFTMIGLLSLAAVQYRETWQR